MGNGHPIPTLREAPTGCGTRRACTTPARRHWIVVSAGNVWDAPGRQSEADATRMVIAAFRVPEAAVVSKRSSRTTRGNAAYSAEFPPPAASRRCWW